MVDAVQPDHRCREAGLVDYLQHGAGCGVEERGKAVGPLHAHGAERTGRCLGRASVNGPTRARPASSIGDPDRRRSRQPLTGQLTGAACIDGAIICIGLHREGPIGRTDGKRAAGHKSQSA